MAPQTVALACYLLVRSSGAGPCLQQLLGTDALLRIVGRGPAGTRLVGSAGAQLEGCLSRRQEEAPPAPANARRQAQRIQPQLTRCLLSSAAGCSPAGAVPAGVQRAGVPPLPDGGGRLPAGHAPLQPAHQHAVRGASPCPLAAGLSPCVCAGPPGGCSMLLLLLADRRIAVCEQGVWSAVLIGSPHPCPRPSLHPPSQRAGPGLLQQPLRAQGLPGADADPPEECPAGAASHALRCR